MVNKEQNASRSDVASIEDARIGYQVAVDLWTYEGEQNWTRFNVMLVANSIIIAVLSLVVTGEHPSPAMSIVLSIVGFTLCVAWSFITKRGFDYQTYYVLSARELEERFPSGMVRTVSRGGTFAGGQPVSVDVGGTPRPIRMSWWSRRATAGKVSLVVILLFGIMYVLAAAQAISVIVR